MTSFYFLALEVGVTMSALALLQRALRAATPSACPVIASRSNTTVRRS